MRRIIFALIGFAAADFTFYGLLIGYGVGMLIDVVLPRSKSHSDEHSHRFFQYQSNYSNPYQQPAYHSAAPQNDFITVLLVLSAAVLKADGKIMKSELDFLKVFFKNQFGDKFTVRHLKYLKELLEQTHLPLSETCVRLRYQTSQEVKIQLVHYLFGVAKADDNVSEVEIKVIQSIARQLHITEAEFNTIKNMFYRNPQSDYIILEITENATDDEVKKAYRKMAVKYHPDKVQSMGEEHQKAAKEKFQQVQAAYDNIKKSRGMK